MKKRIISLILVVATVFLTLTGCAYNYAKDDMTKYATMDYAAFYKYLQGEIKITDGDFGRDKAVRETKVKDAIAMALLKVADTTDRKYEGKLDEYDSFYFCYYAKDAAGNVFFADKMNLANASQIQLGLSTLSDFNKLVSDGALGLDEVKDHIYTTSAEQIVGNGDTVTVTYTKSSTVDGKTESKVYYMTYQVVNSTDAFLSKLIGAKVGTELEGEVKKTENEVEYTYSKIKVESILNDASPINVAEDDIIYVTYTVSFDASKWLNSETGLYDLPFEYLGGKNNSETGKYELTYTNALKVVGKADASDVTDDTRTFLGQLVGKEIGKKVEGDIKVKETIKGEKVDVTYTNVTVNWVANTDDAGFTFTYKPHDEKLKDDNSNKKTEKNTKGEAIILNDKDGGKELTYYVFPVYYLDVEELNAELVIREFYTDLVKTEDHEHTNEDHAHTYLFSTLNDKEFKNGNDTLETLVNQLVTLYSTLTEKEKTLDTELKDLNSAHNALKGKDISATANASLVSAKDKAEADYADAKKAVNEAQSSVDSKITAILGCKKGETTIHEGIVADYKKYQEKTLEDAYKTEIKNALVTKIVEYLKDEDNVKFTGKLPKKAVKNAYNALMNSYKYDFYEGKYQSGSSSSTGSSSSASTETNYHYYKGDFDDYLIDKLTSNKGDIKDAKAKIQEEAEKTVREIIIVYIFADAVEAKWANADVLLTKEEKKQIKNDLEETATSLAQYGYTFTYNVDDHYHAEQFDKVMNFLLEEKDADDENDLKVYYKNIVYGFDTTETE